MQSLVKKIIFSIIAISLACLTTEGILALFGFKPSLAPFIIFAGNPERSLAEKGENYSGKKDVVFLKDDVTFWKFKPSGKANIEHRGDFYNSYQINSNGFRGNEFKTKKDPGTYRIIAIGDSITFGLFLPEEQTYYKLLEQKLNQEFMPRKFEIISAGIPGFTSYQGRQLLQKELLAYSPDMLIVYFGGNNEFATSFYTDREYASLIQNSILKNLSQKSRIVSLLTELAEKIRPAINTQNNNIQQNKWRVPPLDFIDDLIGINNLTTQFKIASIFVVPPHSKTNLNIQPMAAQYTSAVKFLGSFLTIADVNSAFQYFNPENLFLEDHVHPNAAGDKIIANTLYNVIADKLKHSAVN